MTEPPASALAETVVCLGEHPRRGAPVHWRPSVRGNPHLLIVGIPGMGKTTALVNLGASLAAQSVWPLIVDFHGDLTTQLRERLAGQPFLHLDAAEGLAFNPLRLSQRQANRSNGWRDNVFRSLGGAPRAEILAAIFPDFGDLRQAEIQNRLIQVYKEAGFRENETSEGLTPAPFRRLYDLMKAETEGQTRLRLIVARLDTLFLRNLFRDAPDEAGVDDLAAGTTVLDIHDVGTEQNQLAAASFFLHKVYKDMFARGESTNLRQAVIFDEAHRAAKLGLLGTMMQECRKFGIGMVVSSQRNSDFRRQVVETVGSHLILKVNHPDAKLLAPLLTGMEGRDAVLRKLLDLPKFHALFRSEEHQPYAEVRLQAPCV